jgi:hypothetical protein
MKYLYFIIFEKSLTCLIEETLEEMCTNCGELTLAKTLIHQSVTVVFL